MCSQIKSNHPEGCPQFRKVVWTACDRPNHASLFCQRMKKDIKTVSDNIFSSKGNRNNKRDRDHKSDKSNKRHKYKAKEWDFSEDKRDKNDKEKMEKSKIKITKQDSNSDDDDFDTHVFMLRGDEEEVILDDQDDPMMDPYWNQASSPAPDYDWNLSSFDLSEYFPYSSGPSSPSTQTSEDEELKWRIYDRTIKKLRTNHPELQYDYYIDLQTTWLYPCKYAPIYTRNT